MLCTNDRQGMELDDSQISYFDFGILIGFWIIPNAKNVFGLFISDIFAVIRMPVGLHRRCRCVGMREARAPSDYPLELRSARIQAWPEFLPTLRRLWGVAGREGLKSLCDNPGEGLLFVAAPFRAAS
jgi:hypothetical protein